MPQMEQKRFKISAIGGTSVTLVPQTGENITADIVSGVTSIVINSTGAPDSRFFDVVNREIAVSLLTR